MERIDQFTSEVSASPTDPAPGALFHYTTASGFLGILNSRTIWATHFRHLNDRDELEAGFKLVEEVTVALSEDCSLPEEERDLFADLRRHLQRHPPPSWYEPFIASLSEDGNLLSQWRAYADNGAGYSVGLEINLKFEGPANLSGALLRCEYDKDSFRARVRQDFLRVTRTLRSYLVGVSDWKVAELFVTHALRVLMEHVVMLIPRYKNAAFREEREWRLIAIPSEESVAPKVTRFRASPRGVVPYVEIPLAVPGERAWISRVYIGPTQDGEASLAAVKTLLAHNEHPDPEVVALSGISFRSR